MSKIYTSADQLIGKTPLLELVHLEKEEGLNARIHAKLEYLNPAGRAKDLPREIPGLALPRLQQQGDTASLS